LSVLPFKLNAVTLKEIELEYRAQIEKVLSHNLEVSHLDSEKHHHCLPPLFKVVMKLAKEYSIPALRVGNERLFQNTLIPPLKILPLKVCVLFNKLSLYSSGLKHTDRQSGIAWTGQLDLKKLASYLAMLSSGTTELCTHPGFVDASHLMETAHFGRFGIDSAREIEVDILTHPDIKRIVDDRNIRLINYRDLT
jgi:predicted glycoside hydrolase/deacetylase ChbG (UPF0249 family)